ncbi:Zinc finger FYVE domain-containing protein 9 [Trichoplax sp. H2]|nr:Zinc finger FYVE domain-containing protein 9 [Trichoplax sp. H2]|eukprot:RDD39759.1 Zinc finger FYVE domain-containing protein 9 [Trichoplax sp. H2]
MTYNYDTVDLDKILNDLENEDDHPQGLSMQPPLYHQNSTVNRPSAMTPDNYRKSNNLNKKPIPEPTTHRPLNRSNAVKHPIPSISSSSHNRSIMEETTSSSVYPSLAAFESSNTGVIEQGYPSGDSANALINSDYNKNNNLQHSSSSVNRNLYGFLAGHNSINSEANGYSSDPAGGNVITTTNNVSTSDADYYQNFINQNSTGNGHPNRSYNDSSEKRSTKVPVQPSSDNESDNEWETMLDKYASPIHVNDKTGNQANSATPTSTSIASNTNHGNAQMPSSGQINNSTNELSTALDIDNILPKFDIASLKSDFNSIPSSGTSLHPTSSNDIAPETNSTKLKTPSNHYTGNLSHQPKVDADSNEAPTSFENSQSTQHVSMVPTSHDNRIVSPEGDITQGLVSFSNNDNININHDLENNVVWDKSENNDAAPLHKERNDEISTIGIVNTEINAISNVNNHENFSLTDTTSVDTSSMLQDKQNLSNFSTNKTNNQESSTSTSSDKNRNNNEVSSSYNNISTQLESVSGSFKNSHQSTSDELSTDILSPVSIIDNTNNHVNDTSSEFTVKNDVTAKNNAFSNLPDLNGRISGGMKLPEKFGSDQPVKNFVESASKSGDNTISTVHESIEKTNYNVSGVIDNEKDRISSESSIARSLLTDFQDKNSNDDKAAKIDNELNYDNDTLPLALTNGNDSATEKKSTESFELDNLILDPLYEVKKRDTTENLDSNDLSSLLDINFSTVTVTPNSANSITSISCSENVSPTIKTGDIDISNKETITDSILERQVLTDQEKVSDHEEKSLESKSCNESLLIDSHGSNQVDASHNQENSNVSDLHLDKDDLSSDIKSVGIKINPEYITTNIPYSKDVIENEGANNLDITSSEETANEKSSIINTGNTPEGNILSDSNMDYLSSDNIPVIDDLLSGVMNELNGNEDYHQEINDNITNSGGDVAETDIENPSSNATTVSVNNSMEVNSHPNNVTDNGNSLQESEDNFLRLTDDVDLISGSNALSQCMDLVLNMDNLEQFPEEPVSEAAVKGDVLPSTNTMNDVMPHDEYNGIKNTLETLTNGRDNSQVNDRLLTTATVDALIPSNAERAPGHLTDNNNVPSSSGTFSEENFMQTSINPQINEMSLVDVSNGLHSDIASDQVSNQNLPTENIVDDINNNVAEAAASSNHNVGQSDGGTSNLASSGRSNKVGRRSVRFAPTAEYIGIENVTDDGLPTSQPQVLRRNIPIDQSYRVGLASQSPPDNEIPSTGSTPTNRDDLPSYSLGNQADNLAGSPNNFVSNDATGNMPQPDVSTSSADYVPITPAFPGLGFERPTWVSDTEAVQCMQCGVKFTVLKRRHHCRACGQVLCAACCSMKFVLTFLSNKPSRVCHICYQYLNQQQQHPIREPAPSYEEAMRAPQPLDYQTEIAAGSAIASTTGMITPPTNFQPISVQSLSQPSTNVVSSSPNTNEVPQVASGSETSVAEAASSQDNSRREGQALSNNGESNESDNRGDTDEGRQLSEIEVCTRKLLSFTISERVRVKVKLANYAERFCWCFCTSGLSNYGQQELVIVLERLSTDDVVPRGMLKFFKVIYRQAKQGVHVRNMDYTTFTSPHLGHSDISACLFIEHAGQPLINLVIPKSPYLFGLLIHRNELVWARAFPLRLLVGLGNYYKEYPYPIWSYRDRQALFSEIGHTIMRLLIDFDSGQYTLERIPGLIVHLEKRKVTITMAMDQHDKILKVLSKSDERVLAFGANFSPLADSVLVCTQTDGAYKAQIMSRPGYDRNTIGANFIVLNCSLKSDSSSRIKTTIVEDGIMMQLNTDANRCIRDAISNMTDCTVEGHIATNDEAPLTTEDDLVVIKWTPSDCTANLGVISHVDGMSLAGIKSLDIYEPVLNKKKSKTKAALRWTKLFYLDSGSGGHAEIATTFAEMLAQAIHSALEPSEELFVAKSIREFAVRVTLDGETHTEYKAGYRGQPLPEELIEQFDECLIPLLHQTGSSITSCIELLFRVY